jgi:hypothetical protein
MMVPWLRLRSLVVAVALGAFASAAAAEPALYSPPEGDFTVAFAAAPNVSVQPAKRSKDVAFRRYVDQSPARALIVAVDQFPDDALPQLVDAGVYDRILRGHAEDSGVKLISTKAARLSGRPCLEGTFQGTGGEVELVRVLILGDRLFRLTYAFAEGDPTAPAGAQAFFTSFKLAPSQTP